MGGGNLREGHWSANCCGWGPVCLRNCWRAAQQAKVILKGGTLVHCSVRTLTRTAALGQEVHKIHWCGNWERSFYLACPHAQSTKCWAQINQSFFDHGNVLKLKVQSASDWRIVQDLNEQWLSCHLNKANIWKSLGCRSLLQTAFWWRQIQWEQSPAPSAEYRSDLFNLKPPKPHVLNWAAIVAFRSHLFDL